MSREAYCFAREVGPQPVQELCVDRHLLCASAGTLRLEAAGRSWLLPPSRAALVEAGHPVRVGVPRPVTTASVLFATDFAAAPTASLAVFDLASLARALLEECSGWGEADDPLPAEPRALFAALAAHTRRLAERPSLLVVPVGRSREVRRVLALTEERLGEDLRLDDLAQEVGLAPRSLTRRFEAEAQMPWQAVVRRMRIIRAVELLSCTSVPITRIAFDVGYRSLSAFNAAFRDLVGTTPSAYRRAAGASG